MKLATELTLPARIPPAASTGGGVPVPLGYAVVRSDGFDLLTTGGRPLTFNGQRVLTDGKSLYVEAA
jgi:hypothetical protein